jgi:signal transduction histidine kinase
LDAPDVPVIVFGAPDFIAQMLDKLAANAVEFAFPGSSVRITLAVQDRRAILQVSNEGPLLPSHMEGRLFDSMVSIRPNAASAGPHLGMGLYIVRMVAQFHDGEVAAANREDGKGVMVTVQLPLSADT